MKFLTLLIVTTLMLTGCEKELCIRRSSEKLDYEDVKSVSNLPPYVKFDIDFATKIYISAANNDTSDYVSWLLTDDPAILNANTTNYIKDIVINGIHWNGGNGPIAQYSTEVKRESTTFSLKGTAKYDLVDINTGFRVTDSLVKFQINPKNNNEEIFRCYNSYSAMYSRIYQQKTNNRDVNNDPWLVPEVYIWNTWKFKDLRVLGKIINSIARKSADTTITYYYMYY